MSVDRLKIWEVLFKRAMRVLDTALKIGVPADDWSFGGGTVLMLKHMHRFSKDIDIFVSDPQYVTAFSPRVNDRAEDESTLYDEQHQYVKLYFPEGEVDFVASPIISSAPFVLSSARTPVVSFFTMPSFQSCIAFGSCSTFPTLMPIVDALWRVFS